MTENQIQVVPVQPLATQPTSPIAMMEQIISSDNCTDKAGALKELVALREHMEDRSAKQEFFQAFARAQAKLETVVATMMVPDGKGNARWYVAPFADILDSIEPVLRQEGFSVRFDSERVGDILTVYCHTMHTAGHQEFARCHFNASKAQGGDLGALTSAKRGALMEMFALKVRRTDDARLVGEFISAQEAVELAGLIEAAGGVDMPKFLKFAAAEKIEDIRRGKMPQLRTFLQRKIAARKPAPKPQEAAPTPPSDTTPAPKAPQDDPATWPKTDDGQPIPPEFR
ncbi:MAG: hypothetical protein IMZ69_03605 [Spirochaetes bacterium]|nr:hypothetical protein [Spirochaetota bacterium]